MFKSTTAVGIALAGAFAVSSASAHERYGHSHYSTTASTPSYSNAYTAPTINLGPIEQVQPNSKVQYVQPATTSYIQPASVGTYTAPATSYTSSAVTYTTPSYSAPSYTTPSYTTPSYAAQPIYTTPSYASTTYGTSYTTPNYTTSTYTVPTYTAPTYVAPQFDATDRVEARMDRLRSRIKRADARGSLRNGEFRKLRRKMRQLRHSIRDHKSDDGVIDRKEFAKLQKKMTRQSDRIRRLANNDRFADQYVSPHGFDRSR